MTTKIITKKLKGNDRHWRNFLDKNYLGSHNLERGEEMLLTIEKFVGEEEVKTADGKASNNPVLYFKEESPKMLFNITNANTISALYGTHPDGWIGKQIQVYAASVRAFGKTQDALRIRDFVPKIAVDIVFYAERLSVAKNQQELKDIWTKFPVSARNDANLISQKDALKAKLS